MLLAVLSALGYNMVLHRLASSYNPVSIVNIQNVIGIILFLPIFLVSDLKKLIDTGIVAESLTSVVLLAVFASSGAFVLFAYAMKHVGISRANVFANLIPVFTAFFAFLLLGDRLTLRNAAGMVIVIAGLFLSQAEKKKTPVTEVDLAGRSA
jgi:drug/metabolite transporter (DMT)-like permease